MDIIISKTTSRDYNANMAGPGQIRRVKSPKSPKLIHCPIADSDIEVDLEIQNAPPYRILPKVRKPKTPPPPRPCRRPEGRKPRSTSFRSPRSRSLGPDEEDVVEVRFYEPPSPPKQVSFREQLETVIPFDHTRSPVTPQKQRKSSGAKEHRQHSHQKSKHSPGHCSEHRKTTGISCGHRHHTTQTSHHQGQCMDVPLKRSQEPSAIPDHHSQVPGIHDGTRESPAIKDIMDSVVGLNMPDKLNPILTEPGEKTPPEKYLSIKKFDRSKFMHFDPSKPIPKPVIEDVKLFKKHPTQTPATKQSGQKPRLSQSAEELNRFDIFLDLCDLNIEFTDQSLRSSFVDPDAPVSSTSKSVYIDLGDYQTLLKHSKQEEHVYSLPQPQCYGDDTLRAVKLITDKYDTFQRRQIQMEQFCSSTVKTVEEEEEEARLPPASSAQQSSQVPETAVAPEAVTDIVDNLPLVQDSKELSADSQTTDTDAPVTPQKQNVDPPPPEGMTEKDMSRIDLFYRSVGTDIAVCQCMADLCTGTLKAGTEEVTEWRSFCTGIPVFVLNTGLGRRTRELYIVVAERDTGFPLWRDRISYLTNYAEVNPAEHTFYLSECLSKKARLRFFTPNGASEFLTWFQEATADPNDDLWKVSSKKSDKRRRVKLKGKAKLKRPSKKDISQPCNFSHITKVGVTDPTLQQSLSTYMRQQTDASHDAEDHEEEFRPRLPTT